MHAKRLPLALVSPLSAGPPITNDINFAGYPPFLRAQHSAGRPGLGAAGLAGLAGLASLASRQWRASYRGGPMLRSSSALSIGISLSPWFSSFPAVVRRLSVQPPISLRTYQQTPSHTFSDKSSFARRAWRCLPIQFPETRPARSRRPVRQRQCNPLGACHTHPLGAWSSLRSGAQ